ncbi:MAG: hypothetical protein IT487_07125 [Chromatiaceae bacterium]|nr:hypothetical protein [Chromatiaceae bacterium]
MSYTPPLGNALAFSFLGKSAYTPPAGGVLAFSFQPTEATPDGLNLAARAALAVIGQASLVIIALQPLQAVCALSVTARGIMRSLGTLMIQALGRIALIGKRVTAKAPLGLGMKMNILTDPKRPDVIIDQFLRLWYWGLPSAVRVAYQVDDQAEIQPAATWENPGTTQPAILRIDGAEIPGDGLTHRVTVSAWQQVGTATSPKATISEYLATPDVRPTAVPEWCGATLKRQATGLQYHSTGQLPDLVEVKWRHPGAVALFAKFMKSGKTAIAQIGVADHQEEHFMAEGVSAKLGYTFAPANVYFGVAAIARNTYGAITWQASPVRIKGFDEFQLPSAPNPDAATWQAMGDGTLEVEVLAILRAQLGASAPDTLDTIVRRTQEKLVLRIKDIIRKGGTVELDNFGTFKANWSPGGRSVGFTPSLGFKTGTALGKPLTDAQAKAVP